MDIDMIRMVALRAAKEAGAILRQGLEQKPTIEFKGVKNLVTDIDRRSEEAIADLVRRKLPHHSVVCEEGTRLDGDSGYRWLVDPLDGTTNFAHGYPCFAVSIGLAEGPLGSEDLLAGVVYQPVSGELFTAVKCEGAFLNQKRIKVSSVEHLAVSLLGTGFPSHKRAQNPNIYYYWDFTLRSHGVRRDGSAALDLAALACGRFDGFWEFGLKPWDTAAGVLLVEEAGGRVSDFAGKPYKLGGRVILASNGLVHREMQQVAAEIEN